MARQPYPYPTNYIHLYVEGKDVKMAYMDVQPTQPNGKNVMLFHGKNFNGYYWKDVISYLSAKGYRVIVPDQVGWGKSDKPDIHYSFHGLAANNKALLDSLRITHIILVGHSMGGMLATRFTLLYPGTVTKLVLENPIGFEDYRTFVPYTPLDSLYSNEMKATYESYKEYMKSYFPVWRPEYDELVNQQAAALKEKGFEQTAWANALTYQMIYEQPVCYEFKYIHTPTLLIIGQADRTIVGKDKLSKNVAAAHGQYPLLGEQVHQQIKGSYLVKVPGNGHIPHIQDLPTFVSILDNFLK